MKRIKQWAVWWFKCKNVIKLNIFWFAIIKRKRQAQKLGTWKVESFLRRRLSILLGFSSLWIENKFKVKTNLTEISISSALSPMRQLVKPRTKRSTNFKFYYFLHEELLVTSLSSFNITWKHCSSRTSTRRKKSFNV